MIMIIYNNIIIMNNNGYVIEVWVGWDVLGAATVDSQARTAEGKGALDQYLQRSSMVLNS